MLGAQRLPKLRKKLIAKSQIHWIDRSSGIKFRSVFTVHVYFAVQRYCRIDEAYNNVGVNLPVYYSDLAMGSHSSSTRGVLNFVYGAGTMQQVISIT